MADEHRPGRPKRLWIALALWCFGWLGLHRFYLHDWGWGLIYLFTGGLFAIGWFADAFMLPGKVDAFNRRLLAEQNEQIAPARVMRR